MNPPRLSPFVRGVLGAQQPHEVGARGDSRRQWLAKGTQLVKGGAHPTPHRLILATPFLSFQSPKSLSKSDNITTLVRRSEEGCKSETGRQ